MYSSDEDFVMEYSGNTSSLKKRKTIDNTKHNTKEIKSSHMEGNLAFKAGFEGECFRQQLLRYKERFQDDKQYWQSLQNHLGDEEGW